MHQPLAYLDWEHSYLPNIPDQKDAAWAAGV